MLREKKKMFIIFLCILFLGVIVFFLINILSVKDLFEKNVIDSSVYNIDLDSFECNIPEEYNVFYDPERVIISEQIDPESQDFWMFSNIVFINLGEVSNDFGDFMIGGVEDKFGVCQKVILRLTSYESNDVEMYSSLNNMSFLYVNGKLISGKEALESFTIDDYLMGYYLTKRNDLIDLDNCDDLSLARQQFCEIESFSASIINESDIVLDGEYYIKNILYIPFLNNYMEIIDVE